MSDFESIFGVGADIDSIIDDISYWNNRECKNEHEAFFGERRKSGYVYFHSYETASEWSRKSNGKAFIAAGDGYRSKEKANDEFHLNDKNREENKEEEVSFYCSIVPPRPQKTNPIEPLSPPRRPILTLKKK